MSRSRKSAAAAVILAAALAAIIFFIPAKGMNMLTGTWGSGLARPWAGYASAQVSITPNPAQPGSHVTISGAGFFRGTSGRITLDGTLITNFRTDTRGAFSVSWTVPANTAIGHHQLTASSYFVNATTTFDVEASTPSSPSQPTASPSPTATPTSTTTTNSGKGSGPNAVAPGQIRLTSTFNSIGIELFFTGDADANATAALAFKKSTDSTWREGLPLWRTDDGSTSPGPAFYGSALELDAGTQYDIRVTLNDPDGVNGSSLVTGTIATRAENIPAASSLTPTYYLSPNGNDKNAGTSPTTAWQTVQKAFTSAPSGAVVRLAPGSYGIPTATRTTPITLMAQYPAVDDSQNPINAGLHSVIEPQTFTKPQSGAWQQVTLTGPATGKKFTVWKWTAPIKSATIMAYAANRTDTPQRVANWSSKSGTYGGYTMTTPAGWAEVLYQNNVYNYGFATFGSDIYLRMPGDQNPNNDYVFVNAETGTTEGRVVLNGPNIRVSGLEVRLTNLQWLWGAAHGVVDHNLMLLAETYYYGNQGVKPQAYPTDEVIEYNRMIDTGLWSTDANNPAIPWLFVKGHLTIPGVTTSWGRVGQAAETTAIDGRGGARELVARYNTITGYFNGVGAYNAGFDRYGKQDYDIYDNQISQIPDDAFEPDLGAINWRIWDNHVSLVSDNLSLGPVNYGPIYYFRNQVWQVGNVGVGQTDTGDVGIQGLGFKFSGSSSPTALVYVINNTFWSSENYADGGYQAAGGGSKQEHFYLRNNIFSMTRYVFSAPTGAAWNEDYDFFYTSGVGRGMNYGSTNYSTVAGYRKVSGQGAHSNIGDATGDFKTAPQLVDPTGGNLSLAAGSPQIDAGVVVPNIADTYNGKAPDLGAIEY